MWGKNAALGLPDGSSEGSSAHNLVMQALEWAYKTAGENAPELAKSYLKSNGGDQEKAIDELIAWHIAGAGAIGFATNLGGIITMPVSIPLNMGGVFLVQLRLITTIACLRGYDIKDDRVKTLALLTLTGRSAATILQEFGINFGEKLFINLIKQLPGSILVKINQAIGFRLIAKTGSTALINLSKFVPFIGGVIGGAFDAGTTYGISASAKKLFTSVGAFADPANERSLQPEADS